MNKHYSLRKVGERTLVTNPVTKRLFGSVVGSDATAYEARLPGLRSVITAEPLTTVEAAATLLYLLHLEQVEQLFDNTSLQHHFTTTTGETS